MLIYTAKHTDTKHNTLSSEVLMQRMLETIIRTLNESEAIDLCNESALFNKYHLINEDAEAHHITYIKQMLRTVEPSTFYNAPEKLLPIVKHLLKYSHHSDVMIKNAARICLMTIFEKCYGEARKYVTSVTIPEHIRDILLRLKQIALDMQNFYDQSNVTVMQKMRLCYQEELEYIDDILGLNHSMKKSIILTLLNDFIAPFLFTAITLDEQHVEHASPMSFKIGLYMLSILLQTITDFKLKEYIAKFILEEKEMIQEIQICKITQYKSVAQMSEGLQFILTKYETDIDILYTLHILYNVQINILEGSKNITIFYDKFLHTLMKLLFNYNLNSPLEYLKLKLLISLLKPLIKEKFQDEQWLKLQVRFSETLKILYSKIFKLIQQNIKNLVPAIDEAYYIFCHTKLDISQYLDDVNYLINANRILSSTKDTKIALYYFFGIRSLYLLLQKMKETVLPIMEAKENIGEMMSTNNCIQCKKQSHNNVYENKHFLKFTDRQLLILQNFENEEPGIVIFNSYYKDVLWITCKNNIIKICEEVNYSHHELKNKSKSLSIHLKFYNYDDLYLVTKILRKAKINQIKIIQRKLEELKLRS